MPESRDVIPITAAGPWLSRTALALCPNPVFVIGSPRSGTSILAWALAHHSSLWTSRETEFFFELYGGERAIRTFERARRPGSWLAENEVERSEFLGYLGAGLNGLLTSRSEGRRWVDQTPLYTFMADTLAEMFPGARFLHILRDGRRVVQSMVHFASRPGRPLGETSNLPAWATGLREACYTWRLFVETAMDFCGRLPQRAITVRNERIAAEPEAEFRSILSFLGEPHEMDPANFFRTSRINSSFDPLQWGSPLTDGGDAAPRTFSLDQPWQSWSQREREVVHEEIGDLLGQLGFTDGEGW